jgi:hypothetical protein
LFSSPNGNDVISEWDTFLFLPSFDPFACAPFAVGFIASPSSGARTPVLAVPAIVGRIATRALATTTATADADFGKTFRFKDLDIALHFFGRPVYCQLDERFGIYSRNASNTNL